MHHGIL